MSENKGKFKQTITAVYIFKNGIVAVFDENDKQMPKFQGKQSEVMPKIKRRISRQVPCKVEWKVQEGADFKGESGVVEYGKYARQWRH